MFCGIVLVVCTAHGLLDIEWGHIQLAIPAMMFLIFVQAFVMFYFIGVARLVENIHHKLSGVDKKGLHELFENPPTDLTPYLKKVNRFIYQSKLAKRQTIPWTALILTLGSIGFLLGGAHHTGLVPKIVHSGVVYGFAAALSIGYFKQWTHLGKNHKLLRELKTLFAIPDNSM
jgi:hypothetical protein